MTEFVQRIEKSISRHRLFREGERILAAVSGGLDSMILLDVLARLSHKHGWILTVAHFNHQLRGRSSDADENLVQRTAKQLGLRFIAGRGLVKQFARKNNLSIEMAARQLRHEFLARTARQGGIRTIALAHHADDQVELFFLRLLRGAGLEGLAGMKWKSPSPVAKTVQLVRPMLDCSKAELRALARSEGIRFREDATNAARDFLRNRIRHELLPMLAREYQPALTKTTTRLMDILGAENEFLSQCAAEWLKKGPPPDFNKLPLALQRRSLQVQLRKLGLPADFSLVEELRLSPGKPVILNPELQVVRSPAGRVRAGKKPVLGFNFAQKNVDLIERCGIVLFGGLTFTWKRLAKKSNTIRVFRAGQRAEIFDSEKVGTKIVLRHWRPGDRFWPIGMAQSVKLQDLFTNLKVPRAQRHKAVVAATAGGEIFWVEGLRIGEQFKVLKMSTSLLQWRWKRS